MKKIIIPCIIILCSSCASNWNKETAKKTCIQEASKSAPKDKASLDMVEKLCDCSSEKMITKYKNEAEANADIKGLEALTMNCMKELYQPKTTPTK